MEIVHNLILLLHFIGFAALFGGAFVQLSSSPKVITPAIFHGALTQLVTGLLLVGILEMGTEPVNHLKVGIKLLVLIAIVAVILTNRKKENLADGAFWTIFGLTLTNAAIAVFV